MDKKVYIVNHSGHDFKSAEKFGDLVYLSNGYVNSFNLNSIYRDSANILATSNPYDYILPTGLPMQTAIACSIFAVMHGRLNILLFKQGEYIERTILIGELLPNKTELTIL